MFYLVAIQYLYVFYEFSLEELLVYFSYFKRFLIYNKKESLHRETL